MWYERGKVFKTFVECCRCTPFYCSSTLDSSLMKVFSTQHYWIPNIAKSTMGLKVQVFCDITPRRLVEYLATIRKTVLSQSSLSCKVPFSRTIIDTTRWTSIIAHYSCVWSWSVGFVWQKEARILMASVRLECRSEPARIISCIILPPVR